MGTFHKIQYLLGKRPQTTSRLPPPLKNSNLNKEENKSKYFKEPIQSRSSCLSVCLSPDNKCIRLTILFYLCEKISHDYSKRILLNSCRKPLRQCRDICQATRQKRYQHLAFALNFLQRLYAFFFIQISSQGGMQML